MQSTIPNWPTAIVEIAKYLVPATITAIVSIWISRYQYKMKLDELRKQAELKARELLFSSYQKKIENSNQQATAMGEALGKLFPVIQEIEEKEGASK
jgi:hypothetical protein